MVNYSRTKSFIFFIDDNENSCYFFKFDINNINNQSSKVKFKRLFKNRVINNYSSLKLGYIQGKEEFMVSCLTKEGGINTYVYDDSLSVVSKKDKFINCTSIIGYSILYSHKTNEYYDLFDVESFGKRYPFNILNKDLDSPLETTISTTIPKGKIRTR